MGDTKLGIGSKINHPKFGLGVICNLDKDFYKIYFSSLDEVKAIARDFDGLEIVEKMASEAPSIELRDIEKAVEAIYIKYIDQAKPVELASKWLNGIMEMKPGSTDLQGKEVPIRVFFNKIISVREKLRVLEQNINNHESLDEAEKLHLQQYISKAYGSLTTFNILFAQKEDYFKGAGK
jgi:hypothetical protein